MNVQTLTDADIKESRKIINETTEAAAETTLLDPRFYTTDFDEMDRVDVSPVREEWDRLISEMKADPRREHFKKTEDWDEIDWDAYDPELKKEPVSYTHLTLPTTSRV